MIRKIIKRVLGTQSVVTRCVGQLTNHNLHARILEMRDGNGILEYWIDVRWEIDGNECSSIGLLRRTNLDLHVDPMREAHAYLRSLSK